ncbi:DUF4189 domain-containing protein [Nocardia sp. alder85J]|uniref:DUF4189 domain-containing protein n=1 Tax=Nocardia sp. alder85J TaxID=2862949 RepID=UPI001CD62602|nr:DUF4189 domain-containing protein [Nocardia sp. alder85J]MCX4092067.1 DUF4189 domain-containing protein [Nocardia sp. alder85J]
MTTVAATAVTMLGAAPAHADTLWSAIALTQTDVYSWGTAANAGSRQEAIDQAEANCNNTIGTTWIDTGSGGGHAAAHDCSWVVVFHSGDCGALAVGYDLDSDGRADTSGSRYYSPGVGKSISEADYDALVSNNGNGARIVTSFCQD